MEMASLSCFDAVKYLAEQAGMALPELKFDENYKEKKERKDVLKQLMSDAARYYRNNLVDPVKGKEAREYLAGRGINDDTSKRYGLGLSLDYDSMVSYLRRKEYSPKDLYDCGLISNVDRPSDAFANRIIVPIINSMNEVVAFGGRIYHGEKDVAKYKNSTNTVLFDKGRTIYGVNYIKQDKRAGEAYKELILVEGYMDVISLGAAGIRNAVAGMGTALTDGQAHELKRLAPKIYVCYDGDGAGRKATVKNVEPLVNCGIDTRVVLLADGKDPDETVREDGYEEFIKRVREALPVIEYKLKLCEDAYDLKSVDGRAKYVQAALKVLKTIESKSEREVYLSVVSKLSRVSIDTLHDEIGTSPALKEEKKESPLSAEKAAKNLRASRFVISRIVDNASYASVDGVKKEWLAHPVHIAVYDYAKSAGNVNVGQMYGVINDDEVNHILDINLHFATKAKEEEYYTDCVLTLANEYISGRLAELKAQYNKLSDAEEKRNAVNEIAALQKKLKSKSVQEKL
ncbi:MAG: toprim domain-containing protein, partial [Clostridia bacterium]|nr:toprim domain-containing protein [Clostridia bacterium]